MRPLVRGPRRRSTDIPKPAPRDYAARDAAASARIAEVLRSGGLGRYEFPNRDRLIGPTREPDEVRAAHALILLEGTRVTQDGILISALTAEERGWSRWGSKHPNIQNLPRSDAKALNFATMYGAGAPGIMSKALDAMIAEQKEQEAQAVQDARVREHDSFATFMDTMTKQEERFAVCRELRTLEAWERHERGALPRHLPGHRAEP